MSADWMAGSKGMRMGLRQVDVRVHLSVWILAAMKVARTVDQKAAG